MGHNCSLTKTTEKEQFYKHVNEHERKFTKTWRLWKNDPGLFEFAQEWVRMGRPTAEKGKRMRQSETEVPNAEGRNDHNDSYGSNDSDEGSIGPDDQVIQVSPQ
jgi:hypothetical protein